MVMRHAVHAGQYFDSVRLLAVSSRLEALPGVTRAAAMMACERAACLRTICGVRR